MTDFSDRVKAQLFSFKKHPFAFYFFISWVSMNWKALIYLFSDIDADEKIEKITHLHDPINLTISKINFVYEIPPYLVFWILIPLALATTIVFVVNPVIAKRFYTKQLNTDFVFRDIKRSIESKDRLTEEESIKLKLELLEQANKYVYIASQNETLKSQLQIEKDNKTREVKNAVDSISNKLTKELNSKDAEITKTNNSVQSLRTEKERLEQELKSVNKKYEQLEGHLQIYNIHVQNIDSALKELMIKYGLIEKIKQEVFIEDFILFAARFLAERDVYKKEAIVSEWAEKIDTFDRAKLFDKRTNDISIFGNVVYQLRDRFKKRFE